MSYEEFTGFGQLLAALLGLNNIVIVVLLVALLTWAMRLLAWERGRPLRIGFFLLAPVIVAVSLAIALVVGTAVFLFIMFGIFSDKTVMPWFTFLPALALGPPAGVVAGFFAAIYGGRLLKHV